MSKENIVIYVEGIPASGKTTTLNGLSRKFPDRVLYIPEYINQEVMSGGQDWFMRNDEMKWQMARGSGKEFTFVDRGHLSTIIYSLAEFKIKQKKEVLRVLNWYFESILSPKRLPDDYVFLKADPMISLQRRKHLLTPDNMWDYQEALELANSCYPVLMGYELGVNLLTIPADSLSLDQIEQKFVSHFGL